MFKRLNPHMFPDYTDKKVIDRALERLDTPGVSRRKFLALASYTAVASATAATMGIPGIAVADSDGKIAELMMTARLEYSVIADKGAHGASKALGLGITTLDGELNSGRQLDQFQQEVAAGVKGVLLHAPDGGSIKRIAQLANKDKVYLDNTWGTLPWFTPFEAGEYYTMYAVPEEFSAERDVTRVLCQEIMKKFGGGQIVGVTGVSGNSTDIIRSRGRDAAIKEFPKIKLVGQLPGNWNREDSQKAMETLITRFPKFVGVVAQNDDVADGCMAALRAAGIHPGQNVLLCGADGTSHGADAVQKGQLVATSANVPAYMGAFLTTRLYDAMHGWKPRDAERLLNWRSVTMTHANVGIYLSRYVNNGGVEPFDYRRMSKVLNPKDWDPQAEVFPMDIDVEWGGNPKPPGWKYPAAYVKSRESGEATAVAKEYAEHYKIKMFGPSPMKKA